MPKVDYDKIYSNYTDEYIDWVKRGCLWKAKILSGLIEGGARGAILEIGTGRGDVLEALENFQTKLGADVSDEALRQHREIYPSHRLVKIDADKPLPFKDDEVDFVLLCDILEHVDNPEGLLREAGRVGKYLLLKIPVERAFFVGVANLIRGKKYGVTHPSGHLHCWNVGDIRLLLEKADVSIIRYQFVPTPLELVKKGLLIKTWGFKICLLLDRMFQTTFFNRTFLGGSYFAIAQRSL